MHPLLAVAVAITAVAEEVTAGAVNHLKIENANAVQVGRHFFSALCTVAIAREERMTTSHPRRLFNADRRSMHRRSRGAVAYI